MKKNPFSFPKTESGKSKTGLIFLLIYGAFLLLHGRSLVSPVIYYDDFQILVQSRTWQKTCEGLWIPQNEHAMPLGRLFCFGLEQLAGRLPVLPFLTSWVGPLALLLALQLLYVFVLREMGQPFYALLAVVLFAVTSVYHQAVWWFAASFAILALDTMLLGLLAAQRWRQTGRGLYLGLAVLASFLAPGWFALGILAGPLCCLYLASRQRQLPDEAATPGSLRCRVFASLLPLAGTVLFLVISLPQTGEAILHTHHYGDKTAWDEFRPLIGLEYTARSLVDNLFLGLMGVTGVALPWWCSALILLAMAVLGFWWWQRQASAHRLMILGLGLIGSTYLLCYSARAGWGYERMVEPAFARYHLLPHLGLVLFFCGGLPAVVRSPQSAVYSYQQRQRPVFAADSGQWTADCGKRMLYWLIGVCFLIHLPRGLICGAATGWHQFAEMGAQQAALSRIEAIESRCRQHHISAAAARQALGSLDIPLSLNVIDGWDFLIGSDNPQPLSPEEVERLLGTPCTCAFP